MSTQLEVSIQKPKDKVLIQKLDSKTLKIYNELKTNKQLKEASFSALRSTRINPEALVDTLRGFKDQCDSTKLKMQVQGVITDVGDMASGGNTRMFICHHCENDGSKLEFICLVVYKYNIEGGEVCGKCRACKACKNLQGCGFCRRCKACEEPITCKACEGCKAREPDKACKEPIACGECRPCTKCRIPVSCGRCEECRKCEAPVACDYLLTTYSYKETVSRAGLGIGISTIVGGVIIGAIALPVGIFTGGIGFTIAGAVAAGVAAGGGATTGGIIVSKSTDTTISTELKNFLRACFIYELIEQGCFEIRNEELYLKLKDSD